MNAIYHQFIVEIEDDNGEDIDYINNADRKRIAPLLNNELFKARMMAEDGPIARIYSKVAESSSQDNRDVVAEFLPEDFQVDIAFCDKVQYDGGDKKAVRLLEKLYMEPEVADAIAKYLNSKVDTVIQSCAGLEPGDFEQVFKEIRKELKKQGKSLTLLIEDITAFTGVNEALLNVLTTWHTGDYEQEGMCRISSIIGTTSEYYKSNFRDNYKDRVTQFIVIPDDVFGSSEDDLCEFVGRYLNAMSLTKDEVDTWANSDGSGDTMPVHEVKQGNGWDVATTEEGKELNLFPFSRRAIVYLYNNLLQENYRTPRYLLRDVVEKTVRDALWNFENFPGFKIVNTNINSSLRDAIQKTGVSNEQFERMYLFMCIWGDATTDTSSFMRELGGNDPLWDQRTRLIAYMEMITNKCCLPYTIGNERGLEKKIRIENRWKQFLLDNMVSIRGWIQMKKTKYLQDRNPGVPGIVYKLEPENEKQRKLQNVRKLWAAVFDISGIRDIYSGNPLEKKQYEIDHFVPWSFITNDEMWNLMPVNSSLNSIKRDRLPDWNRYFLGFAQNQFVLNQMIYKYEKLAHMFRECQRDNLNSLWSMEELYIKDIDKNQFIRVLEGRLKPIYDSARTQGYGIWLAG